MLFLIVFSLVAVIALGMWLFISLSPQFGGKPSESDKDRFSETGYYKEGVFENLIHTSMDMDAKTVVSTMIAFAKGGKERQPFFELPVLDRDSTEIADYSGPARLVWFGQSAFLLQIDGKNILIDPMFGESPSPLPVLGAQRYGELPIAIEKLPKIDLMLISHDHYDHLGHGSILKLKEKTKAFYVPLGVGAHFESWGTDSKKIREFEWCERADFEGIGIIFTPSRHFSGRGITDRNCTLWGFWVIKGQTQNIYFSDDGGYGPHFREIGEKLGPFDFAMMECGQYNQNWIETSICFLSKQQKLL
jgi:L-ascorbate metabolism protein UlaG (beta-lactamase superfamily)